MLNLSPEVKQKLENLSTKDGIIDALAIDQRGSLKTMIAKSSKQENPSDSLVSDFKSSVSEQLTPYTSAILLDPEYGLPAAKVRDKDAGLLLAYEKTGYDATVPGRFPDLLEDWSVEGLKDAGADAVKFLLYYDTDEDAELNRHKQIFVERIGMECAGAQMPFFLELVSYDANNKDTSTSDYAKVKPHKVIDMMKEFSDPKYQVTVLKVEVPVNMNYVEGYNGSNDPVYSLDEAKGFFKEQSDATDLPFIFLSAGVTSELFQQTLELAADAGSQFNGVLCGRATWKLGVEPFAAEGEEAGIKWLQTQGKANVEALNNVVFKTAKSWFNKVN